MGLMDFGYRKFPKLCSLEHEESNPEYIKLPDGQYDQLPSLLDFAKQGHIVQITEKLDGLNSCVEVVKEYGEFEFTFHSYGQQITEKNDLRGFYQYANKVIVPQIKTLYKNAFAIHDYFYGEWMVPHRIAYKQELYEKWYLVSIYDELMGFESTVQERNIVAQKVGFLTPDILFEGRKINIDKRWFQQFVGKSNWTIEPNHGEGIVIESENVKAKIVSEEFKELVAS